MRMKKKVLFLCTHNSARSQMAEGLLRAMYGDCYESLSAGTAPGKLNPYVVRAMAEIGIDISGHRSKHMNEFVDQKIDYVVTVCDNAKEACPFFPGGSQHIHHSFLDPSGFTGTEEEILAGVRTVRDQIQRWIAETFGADNQ
ncbi:low molecular weight phosphotyrosine protein phosphatase [Lucifera butyrica]|uniref:Low molecular weight phosphotyrosine protein phosphatase n=1 Tax=Lucifera butyrica TaxID=1351585 RepID=A0A498RBQ4_9FIRM|nr:arsenate reductase ArsC [Lucifera butyrica]VBB08891.1 low molecular weight phosphotyrosine protein phosphatase [Lucifera butyrica]